MYFSVVIATVWISFIGGVIYAAGWSDLVKYLTSKLSQAKNSDFDEARKEQFLFSARIHSEQVKSALKVTTFFSFFFFNMTEDA